MRSLVRQHANRQPNAARLLAASVPRLYGLTIDEALSSTITEEEARLAVARQQGCANWEALMDALAAARRADPWRRSYESLRAASLAIGAGDLHGLKGVLAEHPDLLEPTQQDRREFLTVIHAALGAEERGVPGARAMTDWLATQGFDVQHALTELLFDFRPITPDAIRFRLERGADPNGVAPNGLSVIEFALLKYWNGEAVDCQLVIVVAEAHVQIGKARIGDRAA